MKKFYDTHTNKIIATCALALSAMAVFTGCGSTSGGENGQVIVYNWGEYIDPDTIDMFEEETGIKVVYDEYETNEIMYPKVESGAASYDVICPSDYMISKMIANNLLAEINFDNIPNATANIDPQYFEQSRGFDPDNKYSIPYCWGTVGILYNKTMVDEPITSWAQLWDEKYADNILMQDSVRDAFMVAEKLNGFSMNTVDSGELEIVKNSLIEQKPLVQAYVMDQVFDKMISEEAYVAPYYAGDAMTMMDENENLAAYVPVEGANLFFDSICILKSSPNKEKAEAFINFMCDTEIALRNAEEVCYAIPQVESFKLLDEETKEDTMVYPPEDVLDRCEVFINLPSETLELQSELWIKLKTNYKNK